MFNIFFDNVPVDLGRNIFVIDKIVKTVKPVLELWTACRID